MSVWMNMFVIVIDDEKKRNQESKTVLNISSNEGRECGSSTKQADKRLKYDCGHSDCMLGRSPFFVIDVNNSAGLVT